MYSCEIISGGMCVCMSETKFRRKKYALNNLEMTPRHKVKCI